jgi:hypothetical protein
MNRTTLSSSARFLLALSLGIGVLTCAAAPSAYASTYPNGYKSGGTQTKTLEAQPDSELTVLDELYLFLVELF